MIFPQTTRTTPDKVGVGTVRRGESQERTPTLDFIPRRKESDKYGSKSTDLGRVQGRGRKAPW
jgi:hypothetical protein